MRALFLDLRVLGLRVAPGNGVTRLASQLVEKRNKPLGQRLFSRRIKGALQIAVDFLIDLRISLRALGRHILGVTSDCDFLEP